MMNTSKDLKTTNPNTRETLKTLEKFIKPLLENPPAHGIVRVELFFRDSRVSRMKQNVETSIQLSSEETDCTGAA